MKTRSIRSVFKLRGIPQFISRPQPHNDTPFVKSALPTLKTAPQYPSRFLDRAKAIRYFERYFPWCNTDHLHSGINHLSPDKCHRRLRDNSLAVPWRKLPGQQQLSREVNHRCRDPSLLLPECSIGISIWLYLLH